MNLTADNVEEIFLDCLFKEKETKDNPVLVEGIANKFGFHLGRVENHKDEIYSMLKQLPKSFQKDSGGGMSFLEACTDKDGNLWTGLQPIVEQLVVLGIAIKKVSYCLPKDFWKTLPGGVPYFVVE